ncbi:MAG: hypothetical protein QOE63_126 [Acidimicrobiaceae bacterium]
MSRPDVCIVAPYPPDGARHSGPSGVASYTANLAHSLAARGASVHVVAPIEPEADGTAHDGAVVVERAFSRGPLALRAAAHAALASDARVVHVQHEHFLFGGPSSIPALLPALDHLRRHGKGPVVTMHQVVDPSTVDRSYTSLHRVRVPAPLARHGLARLQRTISRRAAACVVHERSFADTIPGAVVIPHGVEERSPIAAAEARARLGLDDRFVALCFGFVAPYKGLELALDASALTAPFVQLVIAGGEHPRLAGRDSYASELASAHPQVTFTGHVPDEQVELWFRAADVALLLHPRPHGSSGALALAIAHRTPMLVSPGMAACTGAPAALVAPADPVALARALDALAQQPRELALLRDAVDDLAAPRSWSTVADEHLALYKEVQACPAL